MSTEILTKKERQTVRAAIDECGPVCGLCHFSTEKIVAMMNGSNRYGCIQNGCPIMHFRSDDWKPKNSIDTTKKHPRLNIMKTSPKSLAYIITGSGAISGVVNGRPFSIQKDFPNYAGVKAAINKKDADKVYSLIDVGQSLSKFSKGVCKIKDGVVLYNDAPLANVLTTRILRLMREGFAVDPMLRFLENLMMNPLKSAIDELYLFLEANEIPLTEDGCFLAYRRVNKDYTSMHANPDGTKNSNRVGETVSMPAEKVDTDRHNTCSRGLHFCSLSYLPSYGSDSNGDKTMIVKINPKDVRAIPSDYNNAKGRCSVYTVVAEHTKGEKTSSFTQPVYSSAGGEYGKKPSGQSYYQVRDSKGKFVKRS